MSEHRYSYGLTYTSSRKVLHDGCAKRGIFTHQILNKNTLCLAHCALNRSFTVFLASVLEQQRDIYIWVFLKHSLPLVVAIEMQ